MMKSKIRFIFTFILVAYSAEQTLASYPIKSFEECVTDTNQPYGNVLRYGADPLGSQDSSDAIQCAINSSYVPNTIYTNWPVTLPTGVFKFSKPLTVDNRLGFSLIGDGVFRSVLWWSPPTGTTAFNESWCLTIDSNVFPVLRDFRIRANTAAPTKGAIVILQSPGKLAGTTMVMNNVEIQGGVTVDGLEESQFEFGIAYDSTKDFNNDMGSFKNVQVKGYKVAGFWLSSRSSQSHNHMFTNCRAHAGRLRAKYGVWVQYGWIQWDGGMTSNHEVDFKITPSGASSIRGITAENSLRFAEFGVGGATVAFPVTIERNRWAGDELHSDEYMISYPLSGPLILRGNHFCSGAASNGQTCKIVYRPPSKAQGGLISEGNTFTIQVDYSTGVATSPYYFPDYMDFDATVNDIYRIQYYNYPTASPTSSPSIGVLTNGTEHEGTVMPAQRGAMNLADIKPGTTCPSVFHSDIIYISNTEPTEITDLCDSWHGKKIRVVFQDSYTTVKFSTSYYLRRFYVPNNNPIGGNPDWNPSAGSFMDCTKTRIPQVYPYRVYWDCIPYEIYDVTASPTSAPTT